MSRRGFTMMETVMAASLGTMVVLICMGVFAAMDRTDRSTALRFDQTAALARVHTVMTRTFGNIVMSDSSVTGIGLAGATPAGGEGGGAGEPGEPLDPTLRPRILLQPDTSASLDASKRAEGIGSGRPQRLEVVVGKEPVPSMLDSRGGVAIALAAFDPDVYSGPAVRGVFELRPDPMGEAAKGWGVPGLDRGRAGWTLWWRPLPHRANGPEGSLFELHPEEDPRSVPIASGLEKCRWVAFSKRERADEFRATQFQDLPAYMELEVRTTSGLTAHWMFEVDWTNGPETQEELEAKAAQPAPGPGPGAPGAQPRPAPTDGSGAEGADGRDKGAPQRKAEMMEDAVVHVDKEGRATYTGREKELILRRQLEAKRGRGR